MPKPVVDKIIEDIVKSTPLKEKKVLTKKDGIYVANKESKENNATKEKIKKLAKKETKRKLKKEKKKVVKKKKTVKKYIAKKRKSRKKRAAKIRKSNNALANALMGSGSSMYPSRRAASSGSNVAKMIKQLYGREFNGYTSTQKKFIKNNLGIIHRITQKTLWRNGYPETARRTRQEGTNVVSFYLHPNGDISGLKLKKHIGYASLDRNTLEVIRIAYKDYPLPNQKTKIVFYVQYSIY
jgi:TonB family protein